MPGATAPHRARRAAPAPGAQRDGYREHPLHHPGRCRLRRLGTALRPIKAVAVVDDCLNGPFRERILAGTESLLDQATDPFAAIVAASKEREATYFGSSFTFKRLVDDENTYVLDITRCLFHDGLVAAGRTQLQSVLCRFDLNWADAIDPNRHHLRFVRPVTFATGDSCRMCFLRQEDLHRSPGAPR